ncbi:MAG: WxL protein peptidoglycan domain-containing protein [Candidatus Levyibacteriota bacterium]
MIFAVPAFAVETKAISAHPAHPTDTDPRTKSWFIFSLPAGDKRNDAVVVINNGTEPTTLKVYPADSTTMKDGGFALTNFGTPKHDVGAWITMNASEITLAPKESRNLPFTIAIPSNAVKGEHSGGIIFEETVPKKMKNQGMNINVISRIGVRIYETVPGDEQLNMIVRDLKTSVTDNLLKFNFTVENKGTVHIAPTGMLEVKDMLGRVIEREPLDTLVGTVVPGEPETITVPTHTMPPFFGWDTASVALYYSPTKAAVASTMFMPNPWSMYGTIALILLIIAYFVSRNRLMQKNQKTGKIILAPHVRLIVAGILLGIIAFSGFVVYLMNYFFGR